MKLSDLIHAKKSPAAVATAIPAIPATTGQVEGRTVARIATIAVANPGSEKTDTCRTWAITEADGTHWTSSFCPPQALAEVQARYPGALSVTPCPIATQPAGRALTGTERASVTAALDAMVEDDPEIRAEILAKCATDPEALAFWTALAPATWDDRRTCRECINLVKGLCQAAARGELPATARKYRPPRDTLHRCKGFASNQHLPTNEVPPC